MKCRFCGFDEKKVRIYCRDCGARFYEIQERVVLYYNPQAGNFRANFSLSVVNYGEHSLTLGVKYIQLPQPYQGLITYNDSEELLTIPSPTPPVRSSPMSIPFSLSDVRRIRRGQIKLPAVVVGDTNLHFEHEFTLEVYPIPVPEFEVLQDTLLPSPPAEKPAIFFGPSRGYNAKIRLSLLNNSSVQITNGTTSYGKLTNSFPFLLDEENRTNVLEIEFPQQIQPTALPSSLTLQLTGEGLHQSIRQDFDLQYRPTYERQDIVLKTNSWTEEGLDMNALLNEGSVINVPLRQSYPKVLFIGVNERSDTDEMQLLDLRSSLPENVAISNFEKPYIVPPVLTSEMTFQRIDESTGIDWNLLVEIKDYRESTTTKELSFPFKLKMIQPEEYPWHLGIDFGTSNSCLALSLPQLRQDGKWDIPTQPIRRIVPLPLDRKAGGFDARIIPSIWNPVHDVPWHDKIGHPAGTRENSITEVKRLLENDYVPGTNILTKEVATQIIREMIRRAMFYFHERGIPQSLFRKAVLSVPTVFLPQWVKKLKGACEDAFEDLSPVPAVVETIDESLAALHYFLLSGESVSSDIIIVYDFGGGTTDVTAALREQSNNKTSYTVIATSGDARFGGREINKFLREIYEAKAGQEKQPDIFFEFAKKDLEDERKWRERGLNRDVLFKGIIEKIKPKVRLILEDILQELSDKLHGLGSAQKMTVEFILAGGSSRLYGFRELVHDVASDLMRAYPFQLTNVRTLPRPKECVSIGAFLSKTAMPYDLISHHNVTPYRVLWLLPPGAKPSLPTLPIMLEGENRICVELIKRGVTFPHTKTIKVSDLGQRGTEIPIEIYFQLGVGEPERYPINKSVRQDATLEITLNEDKTLTLVEK